MARNWLKIDWKGWLIVAWVLWFGTLYAQMVVRQRGGKFQQVIGSKTP